ncbi:putative polysaccharide biosynthesis protein [Sporosalibacterium faouarense]|uniref:putative polysaccharide biosynthesis protein n=1 Tax=Sporosalibacterium faouarense TaxID=516123 RepID=UPI00141D1C1E|nr:polysaccharide biosynthesis protein [Sporosalibacterium faouarense]MTI47649.1 polysaccharide biosynthesis protein [Bacillota bacterium]
MTKGKIIKGAAILGVAGVIVKLIGAFYRIPLGNILTDEGLGYYQMSAPVYIFLLTISTSGFPTAIAKVVSEKRALGKYRESHKVFKVSLVLMTLVGIFTSIFIYFNSHFIASRVIQNENSYYSFIALTPALLFVPIMATFKGYFQGRQTMIPTAISQVVEQLFRVICGIMLAMYLVDFGLPEAAGGAAFGASVGAIAGTICIIIIYLFKRKRIISDLDQSLDNSIESSRSIAKRLLSIAVPITIGAAIVPIVDFSDVIIVTRRLRSIGYSSIEASSLLGQLGGFAKTLINFPQIFSLALAISLVPAISHALAQKNYNSIKRMSLAGIRLTILIGIPSACGLFILSTPIMKLLYFANDIETIKSSGEILKILSISVIFLTLVQSLTAILQGLGKPHIPVKNLMVGSLVKIVATFTLTGIQSINVKGAAIGTVLAFMVAAILNFIAVKKHTKISINVVNVFLKPILAVITMMIIVWSTYSYLSPILGEKITTILAIIIGAIVYGLILLLSGSITSKDFELLPMGEKIVKPLKSIGLLKS